MWATERLLDSARSLLFPLYASLITPAWLRALGATVGADVEASTVLLVPKMTTVGDGAFLADDTMVASYELNGGWLRIRPAKVGKRAFLGNSGMAAGGRSVPRDALVAVLSAAPKKSKAGSSWLGSPPVKLRRRAVPVDETRTFRPPTRLRWARAAVELCRFVPLATTVAIAVLVLACLQALVLDLGYAWALALSGLVLVAAGALAAAVTSLAKWIVVGRIKVSDHPLWSSFVWRNEVVDTFVEMVAAPWFANAAAGTPILSVWLRSLGAKIGRGVWCETYWLPEADLVRLGSGVSVNRGCVLQTHLFHDRVMSLSTVSLGHGSTMGPHGVILPAASIGEDATVGPVSLVMRGEHVPAGTRWAGNPIAPWPADDDGPHDAHAGAESLDDPYVPGRGNGGYDVTGYELDLTYRVSTNLLTGQARITAVATQDLSRFSLDLVGLRVQKVTVDGRPAKWDHRAGQAPGDATDTDRRRDRVRRRRHLLRQPAARPARSGVASDGRS